MPVYCDTNLIVRLYAEMPDSKSVLSRFKELHRRKSVRLPITWLHELELANALQQMVFLARHGQGGRMTPEKAALAQADFDADIAGETGLSRAPLATAEIVSEARQLSLRHTARLGVRAYDVIHIASALLLKCDTFWSFDVRANKLAGLEGLKIF